VWLSSKGADFLFISPIARLRGDPVVHLSHRQLCQPELDCGIKRFQFIVSQFVFVFSITFSSAPFEVQPLSVTAIFV
jgi:hypothetical protein